MKDSFVCVLNVIEISTKYSTRLSGRIVFVSLTSDTFGTEVRYDYRTARKAVFGVFPMKIITSNHGNYFTSPVTTELVRFRKLQLPLIQQWIRQDLAEPLFSLRSGPSTPAITMRLGILL